MTSGHVVTPGPQQTGLQCNGTGYIRYGLWSRTESAHVQLYVIQMNLNTRNLFDKILTPIATRFFNSQAKRWMAYQQDNVHLHTAWFSMNLPPQHTADIPLWPDASSDLSAMFGWTLSLDITPPYPIKQPESACSSCPCRVGRHTTGTDPETHWLHARSSHSLYSCTGWKYKILN